jgi:hypothetical protein
MPINFFRDVVSLGYILHRMDTLPPDCCLYISGGFEEVTASTLCLPISMDSEDPSDIEWFTGGDALQKFLCAPELGAVAENLRLQKGTFTEAELVAAANYYWKNDAFVEAHT